MLDAGSYYQQRRAAGAKDAQIAREWTTYLANLPPQSPGPALPDPTPPAPAAQTPSAPATPKPSASDAFQRAGLSLPDAAASSDDTRSGWSFTQFRPDTRAALYENYKAGSGNSSSDSDSDDSNRESHYGSGWRSNLASERKAGSDDFLRQLAGIDNTMRLRGLS